MASTEWEPVRWDHQSSASSVIHINYSRTNEGAYQRVALGLVVHGAPVSTHFEPDNPTSWSMRNEMLPLLHRFPASHS